MKYHKSVPELLQINPDDKIIIHGYHHNIEEYITKQMNPPCYPVPLGALGAEIIFDVKCCKHKNISK